MPGIAYTLTDRALHAVLGCEDREVKWFLGMFEQLSLDSGARDVFTGSERKGRPVCVLVAGEYAIFYARQPRRPLHVLDVLKL